jgi:hypothetical protein
MLEDI